MRIHHSFSIVPVLFAAAVVALGCSSSPTPAESPTADPGAEPAATTAASATATSDAAAAAPKSEERGLPTSCASNDEGYCLPPVKFVKKLCGGEFPTVALAMFSKEMPWTHGYLTQKTRAWSAAGSGSSNEELPAGEEVVVLEHRGAAAMGGMVVSGASGGFEVLRWDGSCVTLQAGELTTDPMPKLHNARIVWNSLEVDTRDALSDAEQVTEAYRKHRKECKGVSMGDVSDKCVVADKELNAAIVAYIRGGGKLPAPHKLP